MTYYIRIKPRKRETAGFKAPEDVNRICEKMGMKNVDFPRFPNDYGKLRKRLWLYTVVPMHWLKLLLRVKRGSTVFFQHPMYANKLITFREWMMANGYKGGFQWCWTPGQYSGAYALQRNASGTAFRKTVALLRYYMDEYRAEYRGETITLEGGMGLRP